MIQAVRSQVLKNAAGRLIFASGAAGLVLAGVDAALHVSPLLARSVPAAADAMLVQRALLVLSMLLFGAAYLRSRFESERRRTFIDFVLHFWQFHPLRERKLSHRLLEWAHFSLILLMFHRALFL